NRQSGNVQQSRDVESAGPALAQFLQRDIDAIAAALGKTDESKELAQFSPDDDHPPQRFAVISREGLRIQVGWGFGCLGFDPAQELGLRVEVVVRGHVWAPDVRDVI